MGYVEKNLMKDEQVVYKAKIHWIIYLLGIFLIILGVSIIMIGGEYNWIGILFIVVGVIELIRAFIKKISTELAVTTKRVIAKFGFIQRTTIELNHNKVESLGVDQSILHRILNAGRITVYGTGGRKTFVYVPISDPLTFRANTMKVIDKE